MPGNTHINIDGQVMRASLLTGIEAYMDDTGTSIINEAAELVQGGNAEAYYIPAVRFLLDTTLSLVTAPEVEEHLSPEVLHRQSTAIAITRNLTNLAIGNNIIQLLYSQSPALAELDVSRDDVDSLGNYDYISSLGSAPFFDVRITAGGAYRFLKARNIEDAHEVVKRSHGLLAIAGIFKAPLFMDRAVKLLGKPYAKEDCFEVNQDGDELEVVFTERMQKKLAQLHVKGRGCPAGKVASPTQPDNRLLTDYWEKLAEFMVPEFATTLAKEP